MHPAQVVLEVVAPTEFLAKRCAALVQTLPVLTGNFVHALLVPLAVIGRCKAFLPRAPLETAPVDLLVLLLVFTVLSVSVCTG